jgi:hypothetical protein
VRDNPSNCQSPYFCCQRSPTPIDVFEVPVNWWNRRSAMCHRGCQKGDRPSLSPKLALSGASPVAVFKGPCPDRFAAHSRHIPNPGVCLEPSLAQLGKRTKNKTVTGLHCGKGRAHGPVCRIFLTPRPGRLTSLRPQSRFWGETLAKTCVGEGPKEGGRSGGRSLTPRRGALMTHVKCPGHFMPARFSPAIETGSLSGPSMLSHVRYLMT